MKKLLPRTSINTQGFTLVELLVVIAILAILAVIGITVFSGVQKNARDARRKADIDAIANALEVNKTSGSQTYGLLAPTQFAGGVIPTDQGGNSANTSSKYCISTSTASGTGALGTPTTWASGSACATVPAAGSNQTAFTEIVTGGAVPATGSYAWNVCAELEAGTGVNTFYCKGSSQ